MSDTDSDSSHLRRSDSESERLENHQWTQRYNWAYMRVPTLSTQSKMAHLLNSGKPFPQGQPTTRAI